MKKRLFLSCLVLTVLFSFSLTAFAEKSKCITCHEKETPGIVKQFLSGKMGKEGVDCSDCHGDAHKKGAEDSKLAAMPTPKTCKKCHEDRVDEFMAGKHSKGWLALSAMPMFSHQPTQITGDGDKGCSACHRIGVKSEADLKVRRYGNAACDSCHTRHTFSKAEAKDPRACQTCHMGFDHPQWEMWSTSKHGTIWQIEGPNSDRAPTCQRCHMKGGTHNVKTAWGFLALRLPEEDKEWLNNRVIILQALGVLDDKGKPTERLAVVKAGDVARLTKEEFDKLRNDMIETCSECHSPSYAKKQLYDADMMIKEADKLFAEAILIVKGLYDDGILQKPKGWKYAPDLLQFFEAQSSIEQKLYMIFMEYRMRAFQGAFHMNGDYTNWYGWAEIKKTLREIKDEAALMRAEHAKK